MHSTTVKRIIDPDLFRNISHRNTSLELQVFTVKEGRKEIKRDT